MENITVQAQTILLQHVVTSMANGMSQKEACSVHGIHVRTFQREIQKHPEIVQSVIEVERNALRERYAEVVENRLKAVDKIIEFSENIESLPIKQVMDIERRLASIQIELEGKSILTNASPDSDALAKAAAAYLTYYRDCRKLRSKDRSLRRKRMYPLIVWWYPSHFY